jgi:GTP-binding protein
MPVNAPVRQSNSLRSPWEASFSRTQFVRSAAEFADLPPDTAIEVAFAGRSNAGKSSAINAIAHRNRLAFVSKTPGRTQLINFFAVGEERYLVDLPGYGYGRVPFDIKRRWEVLVSEYLIERQSLRGIVLIADSRHRTVPDMQMLDWFAPTGKPVVMLLSKCDKLTRSAKAQAMKQIERTVLGRYPQCTALLFSSVTGEGLIDAQAGVAKLLELGVPQK